MRLFRHWAHITVNRRAATQARVKQMQIDGMDEVERPVLERRKIVVSDCAARAYEGGGTGSTPPWPEHKHRTVRPT